MNRIFNGTNSFTLRALATSTPYSDRIQIDRVEFTYPFIRSQVADQDQLHNEASGETIEVDNLVYQNSRVFDITNIDGPVEIVNIAYDDHDSDGDYRLRFYSNEGTNSDKGERFLFVHNQVYKTPTSLKVNRASIKSLRDSDWNRDFIIIGSAGALEAVEELIDRRISQGLSAMRLTYDDIYKEFSYARTSSRAVKHFLIHAYDNWSKKPSYVLLLGDSTYDPKDLFEYGVTPDLTPMPIVHGMVYDFGSDNWFVTRDGSVSPLMSIGRFPTSDPVTLQAIVRKTLDFEDALASPQFNQDRLLTYLVDQSDNYEKFLERATELSQMSELAEANLSSVIYDRSQLGDAQMGVEIENSFSNKSLIVNYLGHGAEDGWTDNFIFSTTEAEALSNQEYPIVMALNCLNNYFYDPDATWLSLGETLLANQSGGAVAFIGSTAMTTPNAQAQFAKRFNQVLSQKIKSGQKTTRLGDLFMLAKQQLPNEGYYKDLQNSYLLLGDPTMKFPEALFMEAPVTASPQPAPAAAPAKKSGGMGCSASASDSMSAHDNFSGILELLSLILTFMFTRWFLRQYELKCSKD